MTQTDILTAIKESRDPTSAYHHNDPHSVAAHKSIKKDKKKIRQLVFSYIKNTGLRGSTCDEVEQMLELSHQTASARFTELKAQDAIRLIGSRPTRSGRKAGVYVV